MSAMKISVLIDLIDRKLADPGTKTRRFNSNTFYEILVFPLAELPTATRCAGIIRTIIGYNVRIQESSSTIRVMVAPGMQKKTLVMPGGA